MTHGNMNTEEMNTEEMNALGEWWKLHSNDHAGLTQLLIAKKMTLSDFCKATGQHEASLGEWLIERGAPVGIGGYNKLDHKWDVYFRRESAVATQVQPQVQDTRFTIGGDTGVPA